MNRCRIGLKILLTGRNVKCQKLIKPVVSHFLPSTCRYTSQPHHFSNKRIKEFHGRTVSNRLLQVLHQKLIDGSPESMVGNFYSDTYALLDLRLTDKIIKLEKCATDSEKNELLHSVNFDDMLSIINYYGKRLSTNSKYKDEIQMIERYCAARLIHLLDSKEALRLMDTFYVFGFGLSSYVSALIGVSLSHWSLMDYKFHDIPQLMFYIMVYGQTSEQLMILIEERLLHCIDSFSIEQLNIICNGFFRSNRRIKIPELLDKIAHIVSNNMESLNLGDFIPFMKIFRHAGYHRISFFKDVADYLVSIQSFKTDNNFGRIMEVIRTYASLRIYHQPLFESSMPAFSNAINDHIRFEKMRSKDLSAFLFGYSLFNSEIPLNTCKEVSICLKSWLHAGEFEDFPESLVTALISLANLNFLPDDLIGFVLKSKFLDNIKGTPYMEKNLQLLVLNSCMLIERPTYNGYLLPTNFLTYFPRDNLGYIEVELGRRKALRKLYEDLQDLFVDKDAVRCHFILPHVLTASLEIHLDKDNRPMPIPYEHHHNDLVEHVQWVKSLTNSTRNNQKLVAVPDSLLLSLKGNVNNHKLPNLQANEVRLRTCNDVERRIAIDIIGWHQVAFNQENLVLANSRLKHRHLQKLGYELHVITPQEGNDLEDMSDDRRRQHIMDIISKFNINLVR